MKPPCLKGSAGRSPSLHYTMAFALPPKKNHGKTSVRVVEKCLAEQRCARFVVSIGTTIFRAASTGLLTLVTLPALEATWINPRSALSTKWAKSRYTQDAILYNVHLLLAHSYLSNSEPANSESKFSVRVRCGRRRMELANPRKLPVASVPRYTGSSEDTWIEVPAAS